MPALTTIALLAGAAAALGTGGAQYAQSRDTARAGKDEARDQQNANLRAEADLQAKQAADSQKAAMAAAAQRDQGGRRALAGDRGGTIKTSPLGTGSDSAYVRKLALGL